MWFSVIGYVAVAHRMKRKDINVRLSPRIISPNGAFIKPFARSDTKYRLAN